MFCNKYLEEFKIDPVKQYFSDRPNKDICNRKNELFKSKIVDIIVLYSTIYQGN